MSPNDSRETGRDRPSRIMTQRDSPAAARDVWLFAWLGAALGGGAHCLVAGLITCVTGPPGHGGLSGFFTTLLLAVCFALPAAMIVAVAALPLVATMAAVSWALGVPRLRFVLAVLVGAAAAPLPAVPLGFAGYPVIFEWFRDPWEVITTFPGITAGWAGMAGSAIAMWAWAKKYKSIPYATWDRRGRAGRSCFVRLLLRLLRFGLLAAVVAGGGGFFHWHEQSRAVERCEQCERNLHEIADALVAPNRALPPAYETDKAGKPRLSWRVCAARRAYGSYGATLDLSQSWTDPSFAARLSDPRPGARDFFPAELFHCPSSGKSDDSPLTDYVAVVGPDTLWPGKTAGDLKSARRDPGGRVAQERHPLGRAARHFGRGVFGLVPRETATPQPLGLALCAAGRWRRVPPRRIAVRRCGRERRPVAARHRPRDGSQTTIRRIEVTRVRSAGFSRRSVKKPA